MTDKQREDFYARIPPMMHHFPHMHVMQERMAMQHQQGHQGVQSQSMPGESVNYNPLIYSTYHTA